MNLEIGIVGGPEVKEMFERAGSAVRERVRQAILESAREIEDAVRAGPLAGDMLQRRTGLLARSLVTVMGDTKTGTRAEVFPGAQRKTYRYGFMLLAGRMQGFARVKRHTRQVKSRNVYTRARTASGRWSKRKVAQGVTFISAHKRPIRLPSFQFLDAVLLPRRSAIRERIEQAVTVGVAEASH